MMILVVARREFLQLTRSPLTWVLLAITQCLLGGWLVWNANEYLRLQQHMALLATPPGVTEFVVSPMYFMAALLLMFLVPLLTMGSIAEERKHRTLALLRTAPLSMRELVLGKFAGIMACALLMLALLSLAPLLLLSAGALFDWGMFLANVAGVALAIGLFASLGIYLSCFKWPPMAGAALTMSALALSWWLGVLYADARFAFLSPAYFFGYFNRGFLTLGAVAHPLLFTILFLALGMRKLDTERLVG